MTFSEVANSAAAQRDKWLDMRAAITLILLISSAAMLVGFSTKTLVVPENDIVKGALGSWFTLTALATQYYFGTNPQSKTKDETNKVQAETLASMQLQQKP